jgi:hypothetical protein
LNPNADAFGAIYSNSINGEKSERAFVKKKKILMVSRNRSLLTNPDYLHIETGPKLVM